MLQHPLSVSVQLFSGEYFLLTSYCGTIIDKMI